MSKVTVMEYPVAAGEFWNIFSIDPDCPGRIVRLSEGVSIMAVKLGGGSLGLAKAAVL